MSIVLPKDIKYPKIYYASKLITDNYWSNVLEDVSRADVQRNVVLTSTIVPLLSVDPRLLIITNLFQSKR